MPEAGLVALAIVEDFDELEQVGTGEKLLEDALIKLSSVAADLLGVSARAMIEALIAGQRDPKVLAELARGRLDAKRGALLEALMAASTTTTPISHSSCWTRSTPARTRSTGSPPG